MVNIISAVAKRNDLVSEDLKTPFKFGEDFGLFTQKYPGAMFGIGAGLQHPPLHHQDYDFPDELIGTGMVMFRNIIEHFLG